MKKISYLLLALSAAAFILTSCEEKVDTSARYVFTEQTIASYLEKHDTYAQYLALLKQVPMSERSQSTVYQLLTARGHYTVFAPTNEAIDTYLQSLVDEGLITEPSWDAFTDSTKLDSIRKVIVRSSIIDGGDEESQVYYTTDFPSTNNAEIPLPTLNDHKLTCYIPKAAPDSIFINSDCPLDEKNKDIPAINGVIHQLHKVIAPTDLTAARYIQDILDNQQEGYLVFAKCIQACGLLDTLSKVRDEVYESLYQQGKVPDFENYMTKGFSDASGNSNSDAIAPAHRKYGFTIFAERDDFWREQGINPTDPDVPRQVMQWILSNNLYLTEDAYSDGTDYKSQDNLLNQWTTYHILPTRIEASKLIFHWNEYGYSRGSKYKYSIPVVEWYCTLGKRRLLKIFESKESEGVYLNRFPNYEAGRTSNGHEISCNADKVGCLIEKESENVVANDITNAIIYPIDAPLYYNDDTRNNLGKERLRFDCFALFPEALTNDIRRAESAEDKFNHVYIPDDNVYRYFENLHIISTNTNFVHFNGYNVTWENYDGDEDKAMGRYDLMFKLPPVPKRGTYELRYKVLATAVRGTVQIYFGSDPDNLPVAGIPVDLTKSVTDMWGQSADINDTDDEDYNAEIDKKLRNNGLMKGCKSVSSGSYTWERGNNVCSRRLIWRGTMDPSLTYYVRFKSVLDSDTKEFYMDYLEFCPKEVYDNPETPEDLW